MTIRAAIPTDAVAIGQLHAQSWQSAYRGILRDEFLDGPVLSNRRALWAARFAAADRPDQIILIDERAGEIQGFACAYLDADREWGTLLDNLHVIPELKGQGLGRQLIAAVAQQVLRHDRNGGLHLWAYEKNLAARRFYERLGGEVTTSHAEEAPDGMQVNVVRYCWSDLSALAA